VPNVVIFPLLRSIAAPRLAALTDRWERLVVISRREIRSSILASIREPFHLNPHLLGFQVKGSARCLMPVNSCVPATVMLL
jgi:hypothetical protein